MLLRWSSMGVWALAAASAAYWGLRLFTAPAPVPAHARVTDAAPPPRGDLTRLFGVDAPVPQVAVAEAPADARFQLFGVLSPRSAAAAGEGVALIAVDGNPARAFRVGSVVDGANVLKSVSGRGAALGPRDGAAVMKLALPPPVAAATGTLPAAGGSSPGSPVFTPATPLAPAPPAVMSPAVRNPPASPNATGPSQSRRRQAPPAQQSDEAQLR